MRVGEREGSEGKCGTPMGRGPMRGEMEGRRGGWVGGWLRGGGRRHRIRGAATWIVTPEFFRCL